MTSSSCTTSGRVSRRPADLVFCHPQLGVVLDPAKLRRRFQAAARQAGLRPVRFHDLRHTFGTRMAAAGAPLRWIQEWLGHSDYRTTSLYADYAPDLSQAAHWAARAFDNTSPDPDRADRASVVNTAASANRVRLVRFVMPMLGSRSAQQLVPPFACLPSDNARHH